MNSARRTHQGVRKQAHDARSQFTLEILHEATVQVLLSEGPQKVTTTRIAERAGLAVGTLYQYYADRSSLLYAAKRRHLAYVADHIVAACQRLERAPLSDMVRGVVLAFVEAKIERLAESRAFYLIAAETPGAGLDIPETYRSRDAVQQLLATASDAHFTDLPTAASMFMSAMRGSLRSAVERFDSVESLRHIGDQTVLLCDAYLHALRVKH